MRTDNPLKYLTIVRGSDLLPLFGLPYHTLIRVQTEELPARDTRLDNVLLVRSPQGQEYLHVVEWQGYPDQATLWKVAGYLSWLGQRYPTMTIVGTVVYLTPACDVGDTLTQTIDGQVVQQWSLHSVRLWQLDARAAVQSGNVGLAVLSPLMQNANTEVVEQAVQMVLHQASPPQQEELISVLGAFVSPFMKTNRFLQLVGKERLMLSFRESEIVRYVVDEIVAERMQALEAERAKQEAERDKQEAERAKQEAERDKQEAELWARYEAEKEQLHATLEARKQEATMRELQQTLMEALIARFPQAPLALIQDIWRVTRPEHLRSLFVAVVKSPDLDAFERVLKQTAAEEDETRSG